MQQPLLRSLNSYAVGSAAPHREAKKKEPAPAGKAECGFWWWVMLLSSTAAEVMPPSQVLLLLLPLCGGNR